MRDCKGLRRTLCLVCCLSWYFTGTQAAARLDAIEIGTADELQTVQRLFDAAVTLADNIYEETGDLDAHVAQLRAALQLCPACPLTVPARHSKEVFQLDSFEDRQVLYRDILPSLYNGTMSMEVLFIGMQPYCLRFEYMFARHGMALTTLEINRENNVYGSSFQHVADKVQHVGKHHADASFDVVIMNGVFGWGVDSEADVALTLNALHHVLRRKGMMIVGYNAPLKFAYWSEGLSPLFTETTLGSLPHQVDLEKSTMHHVYEFWQKAQPSNAKSQTRHAHKVKLNLSSQ